MAIRIKSDSRERCNQPIENVIYIIANILAFDTIIFKRRTIKLNKYQTRKRSKTNYTNLFVTRNHFGKSLRT